MAIIRVWEREPRLIMGSACLLWGLLAVVGCTAGSKDNPADGSVADGTTSDTTADLAKMDVPPMDLPPADLPAADVPPTDVPASDLQRDQPSGNDGPFGFPISPPGKNTVSCPGLPPDPGQTVAKEFDDVHWVCTFRYQATDARLYVEAKVTACKRPGLGNLPIFTVTRGLLSENGTLSDLASPGYDIGGGHMNDKLTFERDGKKFEIYHSSFGFGFRKCQPMDCLNVMNSAGTITEQGCSASRTLPQVCVPVGSDGVVPPLVDMFKKCPGDPN